MKKENDKESKGKSKEIGDKGKGKAKKSTKIVMVIMD